jgi:hypothetical protein
VSVSPVPYQRVLTDLLILSNPNPGYEADRLAGIQILQELGILDQHSSGLLVVPSAVAAMRNTHTRETEAKENDPEEDVGDGGHITGVQGNDRSSRTSLSRKRRVTVTRSSMVRRLIPSLMRTSLD